MLLQVPVHFILHGFRELFNGRLKSPHRKFLENAYINFSLLQRTWIVSQVQTTVSMCYFRVYRLYLFKHRMYTSCILKTTVCQFKCSWPKKEGMRQDAVACHREDWMISKDPRPIICIDNKVENSKIEYLFFASAKLWQEVDRIALFGNR